MGGLTDAKGMPLATSATPANASGHEQVFPLLESIDIGKLGPPR